MHERIQKVLSEGGSTLKNVFFCLVDEGRMDSKFHWPNIEYWLGSFGSIQRIWTSNAKKSYIFVIFKGGGV